MLSSIVFLFIVSFTPIVSAVGEDFQAEYFTNASLPCNYTYYGLSYPGVAVPFKRWWVTPNGTVLSTDYVADDKYEIYEPTPYDFDLRITAINDEDFGAYHCVMLWNNVDYNMGVIKNGLNENGALYERQLRELKLRLLIGGICVAVVFVVFIMVCVIWRYKYGKAKKDDVYKVKNKKQSSRSRGEQTHTSDSRGDYAHSERTRDVRDYPNRSYRGNARSVCSRNDNVYSVCSTETSIPSVCSCCDNKRSLRSRNDHMHSVRSHHCNAYSVCSCCDHAKSVRSHDGNAYNARPRADHVYSTRNYDERPQPDYHRPTTNERPLTHGTDINRPEDIRLREHDRPPVHTNEGVYAKVNKIENSPKVASHGEHGVVEQSFRF